MSVQMRKLNWKGSKKALIDGPKYKRAGINGVPHKAKDVMGTEENRNTNKRQNI